MPCLVFAGTFSARRNKSCMPFLWPRTMVKNAMAWAKANKLCRKNAVHGADEYRIPTHEIFDNSSLDRNIQRASAEQVLEDWQVACIKVYLKSRV